MQDIELRFQSIESAIAHSQKMIDDINDVVIQQTKKIDALVKRNLQIIELLNQGNVKSLDEEIPPPHY